MSFDYRPWAAFLSGYVDEDGLVDYFGAVQDPSSLEAFYAAIARFSPDRRPDLFPTEADRLAYWLNSYNATVIKGVLTYYPIADVAEVAPPWYLFFLPRRSGFFLFLKFTYGEARTSLYYLENQVIRKRFSEPRIHFALNCASLSCPRLPNTPFLPETLEAQLEAEARTFINDERNVRFDRQTGTLHLSSIFKWYEDDFVSAAPSLVAYVKGYLDSGKRAALEAAGEHVELVFIPYDWGLNDQRRL